MVSRKKINKTKNVDINLIDFICFSKKLQPTRVEAHFFALGLRFVDGKKNHLNICKTRVNYFFLLFRKGIKTILSLNQQNFAFVFFAVPGIEGLPIDLQHDCGFVQHHFVEVFNFHNFFYEFF